MSGPYYNDAYQTVYLDTNKSVDILVTQKSDSFKIYMFSDSTKGIDYDLNLKMRAKNGEECTVNS